MKIMNYTANIENLPLGDQLKKLNKQISNFARYSKVNKNK